MKRPVWLRAGEHMGIAAGLGYLADGFFVPRHPEASSETPGSCKPSAAASTLALYLLRRWQLAGERQPAAKLASDSQRA
eukprot:358891-Chlamydomonas_euryale.AAC.3